MTTESEAAAAAAEQKQPPSAGAEQAPVQSEDEKIWAEIIAAEEPKQATERVNGEDVSHEMSDTDTESKGDGGKDVSSEKDDKAGDAANGTETPAASTSKDDIWANAPPELRAAHEAEIAAAKKTANDAKANAGRMRKQYEELQKASAGRAADKPGSNVGDTLDQSLADYPEIAKPLKETLAPIAKQLEQLNQHAAADTAEKTERVSLHIRSQLELLDAAHPDWQDYVPDFDNPKNIKPKAMEFFKWVQDQPKAVRDVMFVTNRERIFDGQAAADLYSAFKASTAPASAPAQDGGQTTELSAKRAAQLDGLTSPRSPGGPPRVSGIPKEGDDSTIWRAIPDDNPDDRLTSGFRRRRA